MYINLSNLKVLEGLLYSSTWVIPYLALFDRCHGGRRRRRPCGRCGRRRRCGWRSRCRYPELLGWRRHIRRLRCLCTFWCNFHCPNATVMGGVFPVCVVDFGMLYCTVWAGPSDVVAVLFDGRGWSNLLTLSWTVWLEWVHSAA